MIQLTHFQKLYDDTVAVKDISASIPAGVVCGLVGPNGAGKTTTLRCIAGLIPATSGEIRVAEKSHRQSPLELKQIIAYVPDDPPLFDDLSIGQHCDFVGRLYRVPDHRCRSLELLEHFELTNKYDASVGTLSRGMRQKVAIVCAFLSRPKVLLLDEPLTGLDPSGIRQLLHSIREFTRRGHTAVISSHLLAMIQDSCDRILMLQSGEVRFFGTKSQMHSRFRGADTLEAAYFAATSLVH